MQSFLRSCELGFGSFNDPAIPEHLTCTRIRNAVFAETPPSAKSTYLICLNSTSTLVAAAHGDKSVAIYSASSGEMLGFCKSHDRSPWSLSFHPNDPFMLASGCLKGTIHLWDIGQLSNCDSQNVNVILNFVPSRSWKHSGAIASLDFHPNLSIIVAAWSQEVVFYDYNTGNTLSAWRFVSEHSRVRWLKFNYDGSLLYTATANPSSNINYARFNNAVPQRIPNDSFSIDQTMQKKRLARDELLDYILSQKSDWSRQFAICNHCQLRLAIWCGSSMLRFPKPSDPDEGLYVARKIAQNIRNIQYKNDIQVENENSLISELLNENLLIPEVLQNDTHPASVAVIEDLPVKEFLHSRGSYCETLHPASESNLGPGLCCGGHACDLVLTHRDLMRYSLCRPCLSAFWRWSNDNVNWWQVSDMAYHLGFTCRQPCQTSDIDQEQIPHPREPSVLHTPSVNNYVGICLQCRVGMNPDFTNSPQKNSCLNRTHFEQIQTRVKDAHRVNGITSQILNMIHEDKLIANRFVNLMYESQTILPPFARKLFTIEEQDTVSISKRRKTSFDSSPSADTPDSMALSPSDDSQTTIDSVQALVDEAASLARASGHLGWLKPSQNFIISPVKSISPQSSPLRASPDVKSPTDGSVFPWSLNGSRLLQSLISPNTTFTGPAGQSTIESSEHDLLTSSHIQMGNCACCRCGRLVSHTFPLDPNSSLSHAVCADLILARDDIRSSTSSSNPVPNQQPQRSSATNSDTINASQLFSALIGQRFQQINMSHTNSSPNLSDLTSVSTSDTSQPNLRDFTFRDMDRSITDAIVSLMVDDHGCSTANFRDTTYRVCRWELSLGTNNDIKSFVRRPMPSNSAVSYHTNNLIISQVRIFNDSSIALSKNGQLLAALVVPRISNSASYTKPLVLESSNLSEKDTFLAVYRLEPKDSRGHCIYARRFNASTPVCVDFSPSATCLVVGFATARFLDPKSCSTQNPNNLTPIARIFRLSREVDYQKSSPGSAVAIASRMIELKSISHPHDHVVGQGQIMVSKDGEPELPFATMKTGAHEAWIRFVLSSPMSVSVNTILWNPTGGILYGTTKGLLVLMPPGPQNFSVNLSQASHESSASLDSQLQLQHSTDEELMISSRARKRHVDEIDTTSSPSVTVDSRNC